MRVIIVGCGRVGSTLARMLSEEGHDVTVVDQTSDAFRRLGAKFKGTRLVGPGTDVAVLTRAGIEQADVFVSVTDGDNRNIMAAQIAKTVFNVPRVLTRIYDPSRAAAYRELGIQTICTTMIAANLIYDGAHDRPIDSLLTDLHEPRVQKPKAITAAGHPAGAQAH